MNKEDVVGEVDYLLPEDEIEDNQQPPLVSNSRAPVVAAAKGTTSRVFKFWMCTCWCTHRHKFDPQWMLYYKGQQETSPTGGKLHWQYVISVNKRVSMSFLKKNLCTKGHFEPMCSEAAHAYVHKDETAVTGTRWEEGSLPIRRNEKSDWDSVRKNAETGNFKDIPSDIYTR